MNTRKIVVINMLIGLAILSLPSRSIEWANKLVEWGVLSGVGAEHLITLPDALHNLGISWPNMLTIAGLIIVANTVIRLVSEVRSTPNSPHIAQ
ncbi:MAG: hypothetical protein ACJA07_001483 [Rhodococcus sp. (in: high G+C Gram-positive bacteria)]|jgi:hypothetical protein